MSYRADARQILDEALSAEAERICFRTDSELIFAEVDSVSIESALTGGGTQKFKFQRKENGRWSDVSGYAKVLDTTRLFNDLMRADASSAADIPIDELAEAVSRTRDRFHLALKKILRNLNDRLASQPNSLVINRWRKYFAQLEPLVHDDYLDYFTAALELLECALDNGLCEIIADADHTKLKPLMQRLDSCASEYQSIPAQISALNQFGKIYSLIDRSAAADCFRLMKEKDQGNLVPYFYSDMGSQTYYSQRDILDSEAEDRTSAICESLRWLSPEAPIDKDLGVLISVDSNFFRIYAWLIYYYAQQLPEVDFIVLICGDQAEAQQLLSDGDRFVEGLNALNRSGVPTNIKFLRIPVPNFVVQPKTFYASARFYAARTLLDVYPRLYLMDADLMFTEDPTRYFDRIKDIPFAAPENLGLTYLSPWRRYLAGNIPLNRSILETDFMDDLLNYTSHGLSAQHSWMLDQNAITYAVELNFPATSVSLNSFNRPLFPPKFRSTWEQNFFARQ
ncbi:hypothetical protein EB834_11385 [Brevibacterium aurantiacum]|uniref:Uncharacterized protein n=1 Tax=Brevibacterium aurantiacum TaxID=273384 RepID=A0A4Z0KI45_BREAU|nr:hypothetical protein EB834_11385 [Brevibacterium aurantiacum]